MPVVTGFSTPCWLWEQAMCLTVRLPSSCCFLSALIIYFHSALAPSCCSPYSVLPFLCDLLTLVPLPTPPRPVLPAAASAAPNPT